MPQTKTVPCLILDSTGQTSVELERGEHSGFQHPDWRCTSWECAKRAECLPQDRTIYDDLHVRLGDKGGFHGVVGCEGGGGNYQARR